MLSLLSAFILFFGWVVASITCLPETSHFQEHPSTKYAYRRIDSVTRIEVHSIAYESYSGKEEYNTANYGSFVKQHTTPSSDLTFSREGTGHIVKGQYNEEAKYATANALESGGGNRFSKPNTDYRSLYLSQISQRKSTHFSTTDGSTTKSTLMVMEEHKSYQWFVEMNKMSRFTTASTPILKSTMLKKRTLKERPQTPLPSLLMRNY